MLEPRGTLHSVTLLNTFNVQKQTKNIHTLLSTTTTNDNDNNDNQSILIYEQSFYDEPEIPVHPALEFEIHTTEIIESTTPLIQPLLLSSSPQQSSSASASSVQQVSPSLSPSIKSNLNSNEDNFLSIPQDQLGTYELLDSNEPLNSTTFTNSNNTTHHDVNENQSKFVISYHDLQFWFAIFCLIISGVGIVITLKLQAIPMYNYPNFLNIYTNLLYVPFCWAYIVPISRWMHHNRNSDNNNNHTSNDVSSTRQILENSIMHVPSTIHLLQMALIGTLDAISATFQTFAAVYLPGPLLVLVPQAAIPVSLVLTYWINYNTSTNQKPSNATYTLQWLGGLVVMIGIVIVLEPIWSNRHVPDFYCEATDPYNDCIVCKVANTEMECIGKTKPSDATPSWLYNSTSTTDDFHPKPALPCEWVPFDKSTKEKESLEVIWSILLMMSSIPMAISAIYKQRVMHSLSSSSYLIVENNNNTTPPTSPVMYVSAWIAVFQLIGSILLSIPAGMIESPSIQPWKVPENLWNGMLCYSGYAVINNGCHPDSMCTSYHVALWVNIGVLCHVVYTISVMVVLQRSTNCIPLFLALTASIPLGHFAFTLPILPDSTQAIVNATDLAGLIIIIVGLVIYRFTHVTIGSFWTQTLHNSDTETDDETIRSVDSNIRYLSNRIQSSIFILWSQVANQTSYTLLREPLEANNDV